jgi:hypothetical protein
MKYQKSDSYYSDLYDRFTVEDCRRTEKLFSEIDYSDKKFKKFPKKEIKRFKNVAFQLGMYVQKGERYAHKEETIKQWRDEDIAKDLKLEKAKPVEGIYCLKCGDKMEYRFKELHNRKDKENILFFYRCPNCSLGRIFFENGEEWRVKRGVCEKCGGELDVSETEKGDLCITKFKCKDCEAEKIEEFEFSFRKKHKDKSFIKDRGRFCLTEKEGVEYVSQKLSMERITREIKEDEKKKKIKKKSVKQLKIFEIQKLIIQQAEKRGYSDIKFSEPEIKKDVVVNFTIYDKKSKRSEYDSRMQLKKLIEKTLAGTNWRLMSDGIHHKLGILSGRLRGFDKI